VVTTAARREVDEEISVRLLGAVHEPLDLGVLAGVLVPVERHEVADALDVQRLEVLAVEHRRVLVADADDEVRLRGSGEAGAHDERQEGEESSLHDHRNRRYP
jgi:hypothetical protein